MNIKRKTKKFEQLKEIINKYYGIDCVKFCRERRYIDARMVLYKILRDLKFSYNDIGNFVNKNHSTIINAVSKFEAYVDYEPNLLMAYQDISDIYLAATDKNPIFFMRNEELVSHIISLEKQNKYLHLTNTELNFSLNKYKIKYGGIINALERISETKRREVIEDIEYKLKNILNEIRIV